MKIGQLTIMLMAVGVMLSATSCKQEKPQAQGQSYVVATVEKPLQFDPFGQTRLPPLATI